MSEEILGFEAAPGHPGAKYARPFRRKVGWEGKWGGISLPDAPERRFWNREDVQQWKLRISL